MDHNSSDVSALPTRAARREIALHRGPLPPADTESVAAQLLGRLTSPSGAAIKAEARVALQEVLNSRDEIDQEILALRHFEQLTNSEVAAELDIEPSAASKRYLPDLWANDVRLAIIPSVNDETRCQNTHLETERHLIGSESAALDD